MGRSLGWPSTKSWIHARSRTSPGSRSGSKDNCASDLRHTRTPTGLRGTWTGHGCHASAAFRLLCAVLLASAAFVHTAPAQAAVLVSNVGQTETNSLTAGGAFVLAQGFATGANALGYTMSGIEIRLENTDSFHDIGFIPTVKVVQGHPATGTDIATLDGGSERIGASTTVNRMYTAPARTRLAASTTYYVVIEGGSADLRVSGAASDDEDDGGAMGWSIANNGLFRFAVVIGIFSNTSRDSFMIRVNGT